MTIAANQLSDPLYIIGADLLPAYDRLHSWFVEPNPELRVKIDNAIQGWSKGAIIDENGCPWLSFQFLTHVIRVPAIGDLAKFRPSQEEMLRIDGEPYLRGNRVARYLDLVCNSEDDGISQCAEISRDIYLMLRNAKTAKLRQDQCLKSHHQLTTKLRDQRLAMNRLYSDELTGDDLDFRNAQFVYLRSPALSSEWVDNYRNGLVINPDTAAEIASSERTTNEREMFRLCYRKDWKRDWYKSLPFSKVVAAEAVI